MNRSSLLRVAPAESKLRVSHAIFLITGLMISGCGGENATPLYVPPAPDAGIDASAGDARVDVTSQEETEVDGETPDGADNDGVAPTDAMADGGLIDITTDGGFGDATTDRLDDEVVEGGNGG